MPERLIARLRVAVAHEPDLVEHAEVPDDRQRREDDQQRAQVRATSRCETPATGSAPSTRAASSTSRGTWVMPACSEIASNGMAPHTTTSGDDGQALVRVGEPVVPVHVHAGQPVEQVVDDAVLVAEQPVEDLGRHRGRHRPDEQQHRRQDDPRPARDPAEQHGDAPCRGAGSAPTLTAVKTDRTQQYGPERRVGKHVRRSSAARRTASSPCCGTARTCRTPASAATAVMILYERPAGHGEQDQAARQDQQVGQALGRDRTRRRRRRRRVGAPACRQRWSSTLRRVIAVS